MRYQAPITSPLAHYWEEEIAGLWGSWSTIKVSWRRFISLLFGDMLYAYCFLFLDIVSDFGLIRVIKTSVARILDSISFMSGFKRTVDILGSVMGLILGFPIWILVAMLIRIDSSGTVFYTQLRVGRNRRRKDRRQIGIERLERRQFDDRRKEPGFGKPFKIIKFRTMFVDAEKYSGPVWASKNDPRVTGIGRLLRKTRIDEVPQLINVLIGDMSLVGPRPERPYFVAKLDNVVNDYLKRFDVKPGVTGLAQVEHKYDESIEDVGKKVKYDLKYVKNLSIVQDLKILLKTVIVVISARGM